jgi:ferrous iron transport protein B
VTSPDKASSYPVLVLAGQPNCGKSTIFNALAGFRAQTANFPGSTVSRSESMAAVGGRTFRIVDLPGTYSLSPNDSAEKVARDYLLSGEAGAVVAVVDASVLARSLELVLQIVEMGLPLVVALNMMDEAQRKGIAVDVDALQERLGVTVVPTIATRGLGVDRVVEEALLAAERPATARAPFYDRDVEEAIQDVQARLPQGVTEVARLPARFAALRILEGDSSLEKKVQRTEPAFLQYVLERRKTLARAHDWPEETVISSHRHAAAMDLFEAVATVTQRRRRSAGEVLDSVVMHPVLGLLVAALAILSLFGLSFWVGGALAEVLATPFDGMAEWIDPRAQSNLGWAVVRGIVDGIAGGAGIVLPYLVPLLLVLSLFEDIGYLPRLAYLLDGLLHRFGLHGKSIVPFILGYGCTVPALLSARILESRRDRLVTSLLAPLIPCSARTVVILALAGALLGPWYAVGIYLVNLLITAIAGRILSATIPGPEMGLLMEVPPYRPPLPSSLAKKAWYRIYDFLVSAWPVLIAASVIMSALQFVGVADTFNKILSPLTRGLLGLPETVGVTLIFGIFRKELSLILLFEALGSREVAQVMSPEQILVFVVFVTFYVPCVASLTVQVRELGWRWAAASAGLSTAIAVAAAWISRLFA